MHTGLHPKNDVDRIYVSRKEGGRELMSCESTIRNAENNIGWYHKNSDENLLERVKHIGILKFRESVSNKDLKPGKRNKCIDSLSDICLKALTKKHPSPG